MDDDTQSPLRKRYKYKGHSSYSFQFYRVWYDALIIQNIFAFVCRLRQHQGIGWNVSVCKKFLAAQFVQNQNVNTVKTRLVFPTIDWNTEIYSQEVSMIVLMAVECIDCSWIFDCRVSFWTSVPMSRVFLIQNTEAKRISGKQKHNIL